MKLGSDPPNCALRAESIQPPTLHRTESSSQILVSYYVSSILSQSAASEQIRATNPHFNFISFLAIAQQFDIDLLPITWQAAMDSIGEGATSEIRQALIELQTSFAFKRIRPSSSSPQAKRRAFQALITEVSTLGLPQVRDHPNIAKLKGICWDVLSEEATVWPVLVFEKSQSGDLDQFMRSVKGKKMSIEERLQLCSGVAHAMRDMNSCHIIHGDIKPKNILAFENGLGGYVARVTDFGYSTRVTDTDLVYLPRSRPWNAPEHHYRGFTFSNALKCDVYSFGLVCLWIIFHDRLLEAFPGFGDVPEQFGSSGEREEYGSNLADEGRLLLFARNAIDTESELKMHQKGELEQLFNATLAYDPELRSDSFTVLARLLWQITNSTPAADIEIGERPSLASHPDFQISESVLFLIDSNYLVRRYIVRCLEGLYDYSGCDKCRLNAAFQLAFCYSIGFGIPRSNEIFFKWLEKSGREISSIQAEKEAALQPRWLWKNDALRRLDLNGHLRGIDYVAEYRKTNTLESARLECEREIRDTMEGFGKNSIITKFLRIRLAEILEGQEDFKAAEDVLASLVKERETGPRPGDDDNSFLDVQHRLAISLYHQAKYQEAAEILERDIKKKENMNEKGHRSILSSMTTLGTVLASQGKYEASERVRRQALEGYEKLLGPEHPEVLTMLGNLAETLANQGRYREAEEIQKQVLEGREKMLGADHSDTLTSVSNLAVSLMNQGQYGAAEKLNQRALEQRERILGKDHQDTLASVGNLAETLCYLGQYGKAKDMHQRALEGRAKKLGSRHPETLISMGGLADILTCQGNYEESETAHRRVFELSEKALGKEHPFTLARASNLAMALQKQGKNEAAEKMHRLAMEGTKGLLGENHPNTLTMANDLAFVLQHLGHNEAAEEMYWKILRGSRDELGNTHPITLAIMNNLADLLRIRGNFKAAEDMNRQVLEATEAALGNDHVTTLTSVQNLAASIYAQGRYVEAVPYYMRACGGLRSSLGPGHPQTLACFRNYFEMLAVMEEEEIQATS